MKLRRFFYLVIIALTLVTPFSALAATASKTTVKAPVKVTAKVVKPTVSYVKYVNNKLVKSYKADQVLPPASMTKLMTALVVLDAKPDWAKKVTITKEQLEYPTLFVGKDKTSEVGIKEGDVVSTYDLWVAMLVASSNQSARAMVDAVGLTHTQFLQKMNAKAKALGLKKTVFKDVAGLNEKTVTTAKEMAMIAKEAFSKSEIVRASNVGTYTIVAATANGGWHDVPVVDRNYSLQQFSPDASKTGYLVEAQRTVSLKKGNTIVVVMYCTSMNQRNKILKQLLAG